MHRALIVIAIAMTALAGTAHAQSPTELAEARTLFEQGLAAAREERWEDARDAFERSRAIAERPSTLLNLAGAQAQTGHVVEAAESYRRFLAIATAREERHRAGAETALREVEARIAHVTIRTEGGDPDDRAELDGESIALGDSLALDPGFHEVIVLRGDDEVGRRSFAVSDGDASTVTVTVRAETDTPGQLAAPEPEPVVAPPSGSDDTWIWVGVGIGVAVAAGVAVGVGVGVATSQPSYYGGNLGDGMIRF